MNCLSVAEQTWCTLSALDACADRPAARRTTEPVRSTAAMSPIRNTHSGYRAFGGGAASLIRGRASSRAGASTRSAAARVRASAGPRRRLARRRPSAGASRRARSAPAGRASKEDAPVLEHSTHADRIVEGDRGGVLAPHEEHDRWSAREEQTAEVPHPARRVPVAARLRIDPDLLDLHRGGRPGGRLRLEEDDVVLEPEPRASLVDLRGGAPTECVGVVRHRV